PRRLLGKLATQLFNTVDLLRRLLQLLQFAPHFINQPARALVKWLVPQLALARPYWRCTSLAWELSQLELLLDSHSLQLASCTSVKLQRLTFQLLPLLLSVQV